MCYNFDSRKAEMLLSQSPVDETAFLSLCEPIFNAIIRRHNWHRNADDLKQEARLRVLKAVRNLDFDRDRGSKAFSFFYNISKNAMLSFLKAQSTPPPEFFADFNILFSRPRDCYKKHAAQIPIKKSFSPEQRAAISAILDGGGQKEVSRIMRAQFHLSSRQATQTYRWALIYVRANIFDRLRRSLKCQNPERKIIALRQAFKGEPIEHLLDFIPYDDLIQFFFCFSDTILFFPDKNAIKKAILK